MAWALLVQVLAVRAFAGGLLPPPPGARIAPCRLDVNRAAVAELTALPGVGPERAAAIVLERVRNGPFRGLPDLLRVRGVGPVLLRAIADHVTF